MTNNDNRHAFSASRERACLVPTNGGVSIPLDRVRMTCGRSQTCDLAIDDPYASGRHCEFEYIAGAWYLTDEGSSNGTFVNGRQVTAEKIASGDRIEIGHTTFEFQLSDVGAPPPTPNEPRRPEKVVESSTPTPAIDSVPRNKSKGRLGRTLLAFDDVKPEAPPAPIARREPRPAKHTVLRLPRSTPPPGCFGSRTASDEASMVATDGTPFVVSLGIGGLFVLATAWLANMASQTSAAITFDAGPVSDAAIAFLAEREPAAIDEEDADGVDAEFDEVKAALRERKRMQLAAADGRFEDFDSGSAEHGIRRGDDAPRKVDDPAPTANTGNVQIVFEGGARNVETLAEAFASLPPAGGTIELRGRGPFVASGATVSEGQRVVVRPAADDTPIIEHTANDTRSAFVVAGGTLKLERVFLRSDFAGGVGNGEGRSLVHVTWGGIEATACRVVGIVDEDEASLFHLAGEQGGRGAFLRVVDSILEGQCRAVRIRASNADVVLQRTLVTSGRSSVLELVAPRHLNDNRRRLVRIVASTLASGRSIVEIGPEAGGIATNLVTVDSTFTTGFRPEAFAAVVRLADDPDEATGLKWKSDGNALLGWNSVVFSPSTAIANLDDPALGKSGYEGRGDRLVADRWPVSERTPAAGLGFTAFVPSTLPAAVRSESTVPGCDVWRLPISARPLASIPDGLASRPTFPRPIADAGQPETVEVDASKTDLGRVLADARLPKRVRIVVRSPQPLVRSGPLVIADRDVRIEFRKTKGVMPIVVFGGPGLALDNDSETAFIHVRSGRLEIVGGRFIFDAARVERDQVLPNRFIHVRDGGLSLDGCGVVGPLVGLDGYTEYRGLLKWSRSSAAAAALRSGTRYTEFVTLRGSFLGSGRVVVEADMRHRALRCTNSILCGTDDVFALNVSGFDSTIAGCAEISQSTITASSAVVRVKGDAAGVSGTDPLRILVDRSWFAVNRFRESDDPTKLWSCDERLVIGGHVEWHGDSNAYSEDLAGFSAHDWIALWGGSRIGNPCFGPGAVALAVTRLASANEMPRPIHFQLDPRCLAARWSRTGGAVGADPARIAGGSSP